MKNRNQPTNNDWATPPYYYEKLNAEFNFDFDPCPWYHDVSEFDGLEVEWGQRNFVNPPYSLKLKEAFVKKALAESMKGKLCVLLLPVSTSTKLFHEVIQPNATEIRFIYGRIPFIGLNKDGQYVNFHLLPDPLPEGVEHVQNTGQFDNMLIIFDGREK